MSKIKLLLLSIALLFVVQHLQSQTMTWVLLDNGSGGGECVSATDCESDLFCYGLEYTPGVSGVLTSYTTGFFANCTSAGSAVSGNASCVMVDNSETIEACTEWGMVLFNSSGNSGSEADNTVTAGVPIIIHQVCFMVPAGETITISEDEITDLTTNIDKADGSSVTEFPVYAPFVLIRDEVCPQVLSAQDDDFSDNPVDGQQGGIAGNVLLNDEMNGTAVFAGDVEVDISDDGGLTGVSINSDGSLSVPMGTPGSTYFVVYQVCEFLDFSNCDDAVAIVVVDNLETLPTVIAGVDFETCENELVVELFGQVTNASGVMWSGGNGLFDDPQSVTTSYYFSQEDISAGTVELCLTAYAFDPGVDPVTDCISITIVPATVAYAGANNAVCNGDTYHLADAFASGYSSLEWTTYGDGQFDFTDTENPVYTPGENDIANGSAQLCLTAYPLSGCSDVDIDCMLIQIVSEPAINIATSLVELNCENYNEINGEWMPVAMQVNTTGDIGTVLWTTNGDGYFSNPSDLNPIYYLGNNDIWKGVVELCIDAEAMAPCVFATSECMTVRVPQQLIYYDANTWYGMSSYLDPDMTSVPEVMEPLVLIPGSQHLVMMNDEKGHYFLPEQLNPTNTLGDWEPVGYKIKTKNTAACLPIYGDSLTDQTYTINSRFAYLPVLTNVKVDINSLFNTNLENILLIYDWATGQVWTQAASDFSKLLPGRAYLLVQKGSGSSFTIEYPDFDPEAPHYFTTTKDALAINNSPWNEIENTSQPHILMFADEATFALQPGDIIGAFNNDDVCYGMTEYFGEGNFDKLIAMGNNPQTNRTDGFESGEQMKFKLYRPALGMSMDVNFVYDQDYPNYDGLFALNGVSRVTGIMMTVTSVDDEISNDYNISIFPNPAIETVNITSDHEIQSITLLNQVGQKVLSSEVKGRVHQLDVSALASGMYFIRIQTSDANVATKRLIVE